MGGASPSYYLATPFAALALTAALVLAAFLVNRFAPAKRSHIRRSAILVVMFLAALVVSYVLRTLSTEGAARIARETAECFGTMGAVSVGAVLALDLSLPLLGARVSAFWGDLAVTIGFIGAVLSTMNRAGIALSSILATSALLTTITAFSLQGTLSNVFGGVALQFDSSIQVGDWVQLENGKQGRVREIRWRYTVIETRDWDTLVVPNSTILSGIVTILGKREGAPVQHRMWVYFNVDFRFSPSDVIEAVQTALCASPIEGVAQDPPPNCICYDFAKEGRDSYTYYAVRYWLTDLARDDPTSSRVRERIYTALRRANIPLAVPAKHLWIEEDSPERRERKERQEMDRRLRALAGAELMKPLNEEERAAIAERLKYALFAPGEPVTRQGAVAHWLYILVEGTAEIRVKVEGLDKVVTTIKAPNVVGEMGLLTGEPRSATVVATTEVECYRLDKEAVHRIMASRPEIAGEISALLARRNAELAAVREGLDAEAKKKRMEAEQNRLFKTISGFFGLEDR